MSTTRMSLLKRCLAHEVMNVLNLGRLCHSYVHKEAGDQVAVHLWICNLASQPFLWGRLDRKQHPQDNHLTYAGSMLVCSTFDKTGLEKQKHALNGHCKGNHLVVGGHIQATYATGHNEPIFEKCSVAL
eukprot:114755-Amphidinium_carterae.1